MAKRIWLTELFLESHVNYGYNIAWWCPILLWCYRWILEKNEIILQKIFHRKSKQQMFSNKETLLTAKFCLNKLQSNLVISNSVISNNSLSQTDSHFPSFSYRAWYRTVEPRYLEVPLSRFHYVKQIFISRASLR